MDIYFLLYLFLIVAPIGTFIHESGHVLGAKIVKADHIQLTIGVGKKVSTIHLKNITLTIHRLFFIGGFVQTDRDTPYQTKDIILLTIFGPINNGLFALFFYILQEIYPHYYISTLFLFNLWLAIVNIIPFKIKEKQSDGYIILKSITRRT